MSKSISRGFSIVFLSLILLIFIWSCTPSNHPKGDFESKVDEYMEARLRLNSFTGSVLIAQNRSLFIKKGYGSADYELNVPNTSSTKFRIGSLTKQFTAMAVMQLQEREKLHVENTLEQYLPDYPRGDEITIHHLLTHTSGIPNFTSFPQYLEWMRLPLTLEEIIAEFKNKPLEFNPGEQYSYSNSGYILLGYIIEKASGLSYADFVQQNIFDPLGMKNSGYDFNQPIIENRASGYTKDKGELINARYIDMHVPHAAGALYSTVEDLYIWHQSLSRDKLVVMKTLEKIFTPFKNGYAYGWAVDDIFGRKRVHHSGRINGFSAYIARFPEDNACIIFLGNMEGIPIMKIAEDLAAILFRQPYEIPKKRKPADVDPDTYSRLAGTYRVDENMTFTVTREDNRLFLKPAGENSMELVPESEDTYFVQGDDISVTFIYGEAGQVEKLLLLIDDQEIPTVKEK